MNIISKRNLSLLLEPHFYKDLKKDEYNVKIIAASKLLTHTRLDIAFKLFYLEMLEYDFPFPKHLYKEHIRVFSLGRFTEPGNIKKNGINSFLRCFKKTFKDIKKNGFDCSKSLIPLSKNGSIATRSGLTESLCPRLSPVLTTRSGLRVERSLIKAALLRWPGAK